jgi:hypothetical protein
MYKKTLTFKDLDGNDITRDFYFNLNRSELIKMETEVPGGMQKYLKKITDEQNLDALRKLIEKLISTAYGEKGDDGISFIKKRNGELLGEMFMQTTAYDELFTELVNGSDNGQAFTEFLTNVLPADLVSQAKIEQNKFLENKMN